MMKDETITTELFSEAVAGHASLQGVPPIRAELQYVKELQVMDGYGAEYYSAKVGSNGRHLSCLFTGIPLFFCF